MNPRQTLPVPPQTQGQPQSIPVQPDPLAVLKPKESPAQHTAEENSGNESDNEVKEKPVRDLYLSTLSAADQKLYKRIFDDILKNERLSILMVTGELSYIYDCKGLQIEFTLLDGKQKYYVDQYQYGRDPLTIFKEENDLMIKQRMQDYEETIQEATIAFTNEQNVDAVTKRAVLVTLAMAISKFNGKLLGGPKAAVKTIEKFQAPLIQRLMQVYNIFEACVTHFLTDEDLVKN